MSEFILPVAKSVPFDNSSNSFTAQETQSAIEEAKATATGLIRYAIPCGFDGSASTGRWLEFHANAPSDGSPFILAKNSYLRGISVSIASSSSVTFTIYKNIFTTPVSISTLSIVSSRKAYVENLSVSLNENDEIGVKVTSGSGSKPVLFLFFEVR